MPTIIPSAIDSTINYEETEMIDPEDIGTESKLHIICFDQQIPVDITVAFGNFKNKGDVKYRTMYYVFDDITRAQIGIQEFPGNDDVFIDGKMGHISLFSFVTVDYLQIWDPVLSIKSKVSDDENNWMAKFMNDDNFTIMDISPDGDCFFKVLAEALQDPKYTVQILRDLLADKITKEKFEYYKSLEAAEYGYMKGIESVDEFRNYVRKMGRNGGFWADQWAISELESILKVKVIIFDKIQGVIRCPVDNYDEPINPTYYIMTSYINGNHYELICYNDMRKFTFQDLPLAVKTRIVDTCMKSKVGTFYKIPYFRVFKDEFDKL
jgi:hypothetical protein